MPSTYRSEVVLGFIFVVTLGVFLYVHFLDHEDEEVIFARVKEISSSEQSESNILSKKYYNEEKKSIIDCENMVPLELQSPRFLGSIPNITVSKGDNVSIPCVAENLGSYRMAWLKLQSQTILTIHDHIITKNMRIGLLIDTQTLDTQCKNRSIASTIMMYTLNIESVQEKDEGFYMCQINSNPMKGQWGFLKVEVPGPSEEKTLLSSSLKVLEEEASPTIVSISS